ncbi:MAG: hypothetical protein WAL29_03295 [Bacteroidales bacterium]
MITASIKRILVKIRSEKILNEICSGKTVYFENHAEGIAFKCIHTGIGKPSKYYAKHFGRDEYEIDFDSSYIIMAVMEGNPISKTRYDNYHLIESVFRNRDARISVPSRQWAISG